MWNALRRHRVLFFSIGLMMTGTGLQNTLIALRGAAEGFSQSEIGFIMASFFIGFLVSALTAGRYIANVGHIRVFAALSALCSITILLHTVFVSAWQWMLIRFITGFCISGLYIICESWLNAQSNNQDRGQAMAVYLMTIYGSGMIGQLFFNFIAPTSFLLFSITSISISLASIPLLLTRIKAPPIEEQQETMSLFKLYRRSPLGFIGVFAASFCVGVLTSLAPVYAVNNGIIESRAAWVVMALNLGALLFTLPIGRLSDKFDRRIILAGASLIGCTAAVAAPFVGNNLVLLLPLFVLAGGFILPLSGMSTAYINDWLERGEIVPAASTIVLVAGLGAILGPMITGFLMQTLANQAFFICVGAVMGSFFVFALYRMTQRSTDTMHDQSVTFTPITQPLADSLVQAYDDRQLEFDFEMQEEEEVA